MEDILEFKDEFRFLSNFYPFEKPLAFSNGLSYRSVEHFYVAMKSCDPLVRREVSLIDGAGKVKRFGRKIKIRPDWEDIKVEVMTLAIGYKFSLQNPSLMSLLIDTGDCFIQEGNYWGDQFWGVCLKTDCGNNELGRILMDRRKVIADEFDVGYFNVIANTALDK